jgi:uncharacterized protein YacL
MLGAAIGAAIAGVIIYGLRFVTQEIFEKLSPVLVAIVLSMIMGYFVARYYFLIFTGYDLEFQLFFTTTVVLLFGFAGITLGLKYASSWQNLINAVHRTERTAPSSKLVDTSVIIDGRLAEICDTGFLEGTFIIPRFVLQELQYIADSADDLRRARGRRGLDILKQLQAPESKVKVEVVEDDPAGARDVDSKLVRLALTFNAKIITNDLNLNKVAQIEGVEVLNINDLANALKPAVLPDETMEVRIVKEGKEAMQGVGYLDDGTMVVVDGGKEHLGRQVKLVVTSVLQTTAGRMIFGRLQDVSA